METTSAFANPTNPGAKNVYCCDTCRKHMVTRDKDAGTTPFIVSCQLTPRCRGKMYSSLYRVFDPQDRLMPTHEWYKPSVLEVIPPQLADHVQKGGLLLRPISGGGYAPTERIIRHKKRQTLYRVIGEGKMQSEHWRAGDNPDAYADMEPVVIYEGTDGKVWVRPKSEFEERFEDV